ncbi:MAG: exodeoxyribonuclease V subunit gamma [Lachnospiraceae bacterium]|nr:exodeoxyribonuclease V subunit gamma [Lachnospiraceae bacterium]
MSLQFILGGSGSGKSAALYHFMISEAVKHPERQYVLLVPDQYTMQIQRQMVQLHPGHALFNVDVLSFGRLYHKVKEELGGGELVALDDTGKNLILRALSSSMSADLPAIGGLMEKQGYVSEVKSLISEFMQYGISPEGMDGLIEAGAGRKGLQARLRDIQKLYGLFLQRLENKYRTSESIYPELTRRLSESKIIRGSVVAFDGFTGFTPVQLPPVQQIMLLSSRCYVALTIDCDPAKVTVEQQLFYTSAKTIRELERLAAGAGVKTEEYYFCESGKRFQSAPGFAVGMNETGNLMAKRDRTVIGNLMAEPDRTESGNLMAEPDSSVIGNAATKPDARRSKNENSRGDVSELAFFERHLFRYDGAVYPQECRHIHLGYAANPAEESRQTAIWLHRLVRERGLKYRETAVICAGLDAYSHHLQEAFARMDIPCFVDATAGLLSNPLLEYVQGLLELVEKDFSFSAVMRFLRSGLSDLSREETDLLELYLGQAGIRGRRAWAKAFTRLASRFDLGKVNELRERLMEELAPLLSAAADRQATVRTQMTALYEFLVQTQTEQKLAAMEEEFNSQGDVVRAREYRQAYSKLMGLFDQMAALMGEEQLAFGETARILRAGFEELRVGAIPARLDQVLVGDLERTRLPQVKVLFVLGVNDVNIPGSSGRGGMLSDLEREYLLDRGVELAPSRRQLQFRQRFYLYQQLTSPGEELYLSWSLVDNGQKELRPSYFIHTVQKLFPSLWAKPLGEEQPEHVSELPLRVAVLLQKYVQGLSGESETDELLELLVLFRKYYGDAGVTSYIEGAFRQGGRERIAPEIARDLYGSVLYGSISRLENFAACPYAHFLKYGLRLREPREYRPESVDMGNIFHDVLAGFGRDLGEAGYDWQSFPADFAEEKLNSRLEEVRTLYGDELILDKARNGYALERAGRILRRTVEVLQTHMQAGNFRTYGLELPFSVDCQWNPSRELFMRLEGRIDRVDVAEQDQDVYVKVIDYKSGNQQFSVDSLYAGLQLQLTVYLDMASRQLAEQNPGKRVRPAAMFYYRVADPVVDMEGEESLDELPQLRLREQRSRGILNDSPEAVELLDHTFEKSSDVIPFTRNKDGQAARGSKSCTEEELLLMERYSEHKVDELGRQIRQGHIEASPYQQGTEEGCTWCPYRGCCSYDEKLPGYRKRRIPVMEQEEALEKMRESLREDT